MGKYKMGLILGRFQTLHIGHEYIINKALEKCEKILILIGSSDKYGTYENPFKYEFRKEMLKEIFNNEKIIIEPLRDLGIGDIPEWGEYLLYNAETIVGKIDCIIYGEESKCHTWYNEKRKKEIKFISISRNEININASELRKYMEKNEYEQWKKYVNPKLHKYYKRMRDILLKTILIT